jgi:hypothetical protein
VELLLEKSAQQVITALTVFEWMKFFEISSVLKLLPTQLLILPVAYPFKVSL